MVPSKKSVAPAGLILGLGLNRGNEEKWFRKRKCTEDIVRR